MARKILNSGKSVDLRVLTSKGELREYKQCHSLEWGEKQFRGGYRNIKMDASGQIRKIKDILIVGLDDFEVYL